MNRENLDRLVLEECAASTDAAVAAEARRRLQEREDDDALVRAVRERRGDAEDLRRNARTLWERNCATPTRVVAAVDRIAALAEEAPRTTFQEYRAIWHSEAFLKNAGWTLGQRTALRIEQRVRRWFPSVRVPGVSDLMRYRNAKASQ